MQWPKAFEGGYVTGHEAIRAYWTRQWAEITPHVQPVSVTARPNGTLVVAVQQRVQDLQGATFFDGVVTHVYTRQDGLLRRMNIDLHLGPAS